MVGRQRVSEILRCMCGCGPDELLGARGPRRGGRGTGGVQAALGGVPRLPPITGVLLIAAGCVQAPVRSELLRAANDMSSAHASSIAGNPRPFAASSDRQHRLDVIQRAGRVQRSLADMGYGEAPWHFRGRALYQLSLVPVEEVRGSATDGTVWPALRVAGRVTATTHRRVVTPEGPADLCCSVQCLQARKYVPPELPLVSFLGYTLGGFYLARYSGGCGRCSEALRLGPAAACASSRQAAGLSQNTVAKPPSVRPQTRRWARLTSAWRWRGWPGTSRPAAPGPRACT